MAKKFLFVLLAVLGLPAGELAAQTPLEGTTMSSQGDLPHAEGFVSRGDSVSLLIEAIAAKMQRAPVISAKARKKQISGSFDLADATKTLETISRDTGLIWFSDGQSLYVYDASEIRSTVGNMHNASIQTLNDFLVKTSLIDARFPVRGEGRDGTFYISAPPIYVDIVINAASYLDSLYRGVDTDTERVEVIKLEHSFVYGRSFDVRGTTTTVPGVAQIVNTMLTGSTLPMTAPVASPDQGGSPASAQPVVATPSIPPVTTNTQGALVVAYPETNSLLVRGTLSQIQLVKRLVAQIDIPRRQIELSVWIIDLRKEDLDNLGIAWSGGANVGRKFAVGFNQQASLSSGDGARFLSSIKALSARGDATIVSRPVVLTQENVPAIFDNNTTFYTRLVGERNSSLDQVTFGTLLSVLPRISSAEDIEMQLRIEDGNATHGAETDVDGLPVVGRTRIDTVARVPQSHSLLVGGYTHHQQIVGESRIPGLSRLPLIGGAFRSRGKTSSRMARVFLIQPRTIVAADMRNKVDTGTQWTPTAVMSVEDEVDAIRRGGGGARVY